MRTTRQKGPPASARPGALSAAVLAFGLLLIGLQPGCSASTLTEVNSPGSAKVRKDTTIVHQECDTKSSGAEKIDANGDGRPDITIVKSGGHEVCRAVDLNFDGKVDVWVYRNPAGQVTRRETDYDRDGRIDEISTYKNGVLTEKDRATTLAGKLDTWEYYQDGRSDACGARLRRRRRGRSVVGVSRGRPSPDARSSIPTSTATDAPTRTRRWTCARTPATCRRSGAPSTRSRAPTSRGPGAVPTELQNKPAGSANGGGADKKGTK